MACACCTQRSHNASIRKDSISIPTYIIKKKSYRGAKHGNSQIQRKYHKAEDCLRKAKKNHFTSILQRFQESETYRNSQLSHNWDEDFCKELDQLAVEDHSSTATNAKSMREIVGIQNEYSSLVGPKRLRPDYSDASQRFGEMRTQEGDENVKISPSEPTIRSCGEMKI